jgi:spoIIIJ-associated protein
MLIGRKGKNLDALQLLVNVVTNRLEHSDMKIVLDSENYRSRREENLIRLAHKVGDQVKRSGRSHLLEPMNPFERRLIHTTLNDIEDIATKSEGEGLYKQVRIYHRGNEPEE